MRTFWNINHTLRTTEQWEPNCWIQVTCPTGDDETYLTEELNVPSFFLDDIRDKDERSRYEYDEGWVLIILRIPYVKEVRSRTPHTTVPLGIIINKEVCLTVCNFETNMMIDFVSYQQKRNMGFTDSVDLVFRLFLSSSVWYLKRLKLINTLIEESKRNLDKKIDNEDLIGLSRLQDSLTYFITSIRGNETLLAKLKFKLPVDELDADLIEDVNIEMSQARETTNIYTNILDSTMETYASIINNNTSSIMKTMTSISIILMFPTLIASIFGMNVISGMEDAWWGFPLITFMSFLTTGVFFWYFKRKTWL
ncbi:MAG: magnesium transporter CorA family protein [Bacteroidaceae bacterium]